MDVEAIDQTEFYQDDLVCTVCYAEFLDHEDLQVHIKQLHLNVTNKNRYCELCVHIFHDIEEYALHLRNKHINSLKCCKYCTRLFQTALEVQEHEKKHNSAVLYPRVSCSHCKNVFHSKEEVRNHEYKEHSESYGFILSDGLPIISSLLCMNIYNFFNSVPYKCVKCDKTTVDVNTYIQHLVENNKCRAHTCNKCCKVFKTKSKLRTHVLTHLQESIDKDLSVQCSKCKQSLKPAFLRSHKKTCTGMCCTLCDLYFTSVAEYTNHRLAEHRNKLPSLEVCIYCQRQMVGVESLKKHIERVHPDKHLYKYHCTDCKRIFKHPKFLFAHFFSSHKDLHPYTCKICDKTFKVRKGFSLHIKLTHNSVGFVEFDDNFHVYFTDKKSDKQSKSQTELENSDDNYDDDQVDVSIYDTNDHNYCQNSYEDKHLTVNNSKIEIEKKVNKHSDDHIEPKKEINGLQQKDTKSNKSNNKKDQIIKENVRKNTQKNLKENYVAKTIGELDERPVNKAVKKPLLKRKQTEVKTSQIKDLNDDVGSSDDSNIPLQAVSKKLKLQKNKMRTSFKRQPAQTKKFICKTCNRNCYTYQNYHRHKTLHTKNETKVCIKCFAKYDSVKKLNEHIKKEHSSSQLTETLKKLLEKRKVAEAKLKEEAKSKEITIPKDEVITPPEMLPLSTTERFCNTIKKFNNERIIPTKVTMKLIDKDKISVKKYLENFIPDNSEVKIRVIKDPVSLETARIKKLRPLIKLTKFNPEPIIYEKVSLKMPVKFTDDLKEQFQVSIKLESDYQPPAMTFNTNMDNKSEENYNDYDTYESYKPEEENKDAIPEVAQEVMLEGADVQNSVIHTMNLNIIPSWHNNVRIAHLSSEAPYFKISKVNLGEEDSFTLVPEIKKKENTETPKDITLPSGKKLVSVNPFEHLLDKKAINELKSSKHRGYKPRIRNMAEAIKTAIQKLEQTPSTKQKKKG